MTGSAPLGSGVSNALQPQGILITYGSNILIGGPAPGAGNVISGNQGDGIASMAALSPIAANDTIQGNFVGTDATGTKPLGNGQDGIFLSGPTGVLVGGTVAGAGNVISNNGGNGINTFPGATGLTIQGNYIGTDVTGTQAMGNAGAGVYIWSPVQVLIGGTTTGAGNVISNNGGDGIDTFTTAQSLTIEGNDIGTDVTGLKAMGNGGSGVNATIANVTIGGTAAGTGNIIAFNGGSTEVATDLAGVLITASPVSVFGNSIFGNKAKGIDLNGGQGNFGQPAPVLTSASSSTTSATIVGALTAAASTTYTIQFYASNAADAAGFAEGQTFLGSTTVTTNATGQVNISFGLSAPIPSGQLVTATATDPLGNVSEFAPEVAPYVLAAGATLAADLGVTVTTSASPVVAGTNETYTVTVTNSSSSSDAAGVVLTDVLPRGATFISASGAQGTAPTQNGGVVTAALGTLSAGASAVVTITVTAGPSATVAFTDIASVTSALPDPSLANNEASRFSDRHARGRGDGGDHPAGDQPGDRGTERDLDGHGRERRPQRRLQRGAQRHAPRGRDDCLGSPHARARAGDQPGHRGQSQQDGHDHRYAAGGIHGNLDLHRHDSAGRGPRTQLHSQRHHDHRRPEYGEQHGVHLDARLAGSQPDGGDRSAQPGAGRPEPDLHHHRHQRRSQRRDRRGAHRHGAHDGHATYVQGTASASQGSVPSILNGIVTANIGTLLPNSIATVTVGVMPTAVPSVVNMASVTSTTTAPVVATATSTTTVSPDADLSVAVVPSPVPAQVGQPLVYTVTVTNNGPSTASNVVVVNTQDPNVTFGSATDTAAGKPPAFAAGNVTTNVGNLASGRLRHRDDHRDAERARCHPPADKHTHCPRAHRHGHRQQHGQRLRPRHARPQRGE